MMLSKKRFRDLHLCQLDAALAVWRAASLPPRPATGWIKAIREALGMPAAYLAEKLGVVHSTVVRLEKSEADDAITLGSLRRVAEALDCELHYGFVPRQSLQETLKHRADVIARERMSHVAHSMALEAQGTSSERVEQQVKELSASLLAGSKRDLWR